MELILVEYWNGEAYEDSCEYPIGVFSTQELADIAGTAYVKLNAHRGSYDTRTISVDEVI